MVVDGLDKHRDVFKSKFSLLPHEKDTLGKNLCLDTFSQIWGFLNDWNGFSRYFFNFKNST